MCLWGGCGFLKIFLFIYLTEKEREITSRQRERGSRIPTEQRARCGTRSQDPEIMTWAEGSGLTHWATQVSPSGSFFNTLRFICEKMFMYLSEIEHEWGRAEGEGVRSRLPIEQRTQCGPGSQDPEIMTWAEGSCLRDWATQVPSKSFFLYLAVEMGETGNDWSIVEDVA